MRLIYFKGKPIINECFERYEDETNLQYLNQVKKNLAKTKKMIDSILKTSIKDIPDEKLLKIVGTCYQPFVNDFLPDVMDAKYNGVAKQIKLKTDDTVSYVETDGHGRDFSWWTVWKELAYIAYTIKDFPEEDRIYKKEEVFDLVNNNVIDVIYMVQYSSTTKCNDKLKLQEKNSKKYQIKVSDFAKPETLFARLKNMNKNELLKFCAENKFLIKLLRSELTDEGVHEDFEILNSLYEKGLKRFEDVKTSILSTIEKSKNQLKSSIIKDEQKISKSKKEIERLEEESNSIQDL